MLVGGILSMSVAANVRPPTTAATAVVGEFTGCVVVLLSCGGSCAGGVRPTSSPTSSKCSYR